MVVYQISTRKSRAKRKQKSASLKVLKTQFETTIFYNSTEEKLAFVFSIFIPIQNPYRFIFPIAIFPAFRIKTLLNNYTC